MFVGLVELIFSYVVSRRLFKERLGRRELANEARSLHAAAEEDEDALDTDKFIRTMGWRRVAEQEGMMRVENVGLEMVEALREPGGERQAHGKVAAVEILDCRDALDDRQPEPGSPGAGARRVEARERPLHALDLRFRFGRQRPNHHVEHIGRKTKLVRFVAQKLQ